MVHFTNDSLVITIKSPNPEADLNAILTGLNGVMRIAAHCPASDLRNIIDLDAKIIVYDLIEALIPDEYQLQKGVERYDLSKSLKTK